jgi:hypothetical protein
MFPSFLFTYLTKMSPDYRYFGSRNKGPFDIIRKYYDKYGYGLILNGREYFLLKETGQFNTRRIKAKFVNLGIEQLILF